MIWYWASWIAFIALSFAVAEGYALATGKITLSRSIWTWQAHFPAFEGFAMLLAGFLFCHFFWTGAWCSVNTPVLH